MPLQQNEIQKVVRYKYSKNQLKPFLVSEIFIGYGKSEKRGRLYQNKWMRMRFKGGQSSSPVKQSKDVRRGPHYLCGESNTIQESGQLQLRAQKQEASSSGSAVFSQLYQIEA